MGNIYWDDQGPANFAALRRGLGPSRISLMKRCLHCLVICQRKPYLSWEQSAEPSMCSHGRILFGDIKCWIATEAISNSTGTGDLLMPINRSRRRISNPLNYYHPSKCLDSTLITFTKFGGVRLVI